MATKNHNIRFNMEKEEERRAWELLHSVEVDQHFKSLNRFVIEAINDYYDRKEALYDDPYLETREKKDAFVDRIADMVEQKVLCNIPALAGVYLMQQQSLLSVSMQNGIAPAIPQVNQNVQVDRKADGLEHSKGVADNLEEFVNASNDEDVEDNELVDFDIF